MYKLYKLSFIVPTVNNGLSDNGRAWFYDHKIKKANITDTDVCV